MLHLLWSIVVGFVVGLTARALVPGADAMGFWMTSGLGIAGSIAGGLAARLFSKPEVGAKLHPAGFVLSLVGAVVLLAAWKMIQSRWRDCEPTSAKVKRKPLRRGVRAERRTVN